jgi:hypothetical protein
MKTLKLTVALSFILLLAAGAYAQDANVSFRTGVVGGTWCPILGPDMLPLADGSYVMIILAGGNGIPDPVGASGAPGGDDVQPTGNNIDHIALHLGEPPFIPPGNMYSVGNTLICPPAGMGVEPIVNHSDIMYMRAFNSPDPATATHANDLISVDGTPALTYTIPGAGPYITIVCFGEAYSIISVCHPQEAAGPEAAMIPQGTTHYFFGESESFHCTLWIDATGGYVDVTEAVVVDAEPPCQPYPATNYMTRYYELWGQPESFFDVYFGWRQDEYDASDFGVGQETQMHVAWYDGSVAACDGEWIKTQPIPALITVTPPVGGYAQVTTDHMSLWSFGWDGGETQLPVELVSFEALAGDRSAVLNWATASEQNNAGFHIERSTDGENFMRVTNQMIEGALNSSTTSEYTYTDTHLNNGVHYIYRLIDVDINGNEYINETTAEVTPSFLGEAIVITEYKLHQNYPNPFNPTTTLVYDVKDEGMVTLKVYNVMGQEVAELVNQSRENGRYAVSFDATGLSSGIYFYTVKVNNFTDTKKMLLVQ